MQCSGVQYATGSVTCWREATISVSRTSKAGAGYYVGMRAACDRHVAHAMRVCLDETSEVRVVRV